MLYFVKKPKWIRKLYGDCTWQVDTTDKVLYLTFEDGPDANETPFVLEQLSKFNAKATFFCLGKNVQQFPGLYQDVIKHGHSVGNHTFSHLDGWKSASKKYYNDISAAGKLIDSNLFRPPYGHITWWQVNKLRSAPFGLRTILWDVLSADFDADTPAEKCAGNVINNAQPGSIILFHDSAIASSNLRYALPKVLEHFTAAGYRFDALRA